MKDSGSNDPSKPVTNTPQPTNLPWGQCGHYTSASRPWWGVDLGASHWLAKVVLYSRTDGAAYRLQDANIYLGDNWDLYDGNVLVASGVDVPAGAPLEVVALPIALPLPVPRPGMHWKGGEVPPPPNTALPIALPLPVPRPGMHWKGGEVPPPPSRAPSLCPATVSLTPSAGFSSICNRQ